ncbi:proline--tRNA ligase [Candidatus Bathyarchaeota archaeon]|nr:proline--tRNA ligase [Candidatus Bathyarchaeota archaeon]
MVVKRKKWSEDFAEWFRSTLIDATVMDYRYPIKGCGVWLPYGFKIRRNILQILRDLLDSTGHEETLFPLLIPESSLAKESTHVQGFEEECFWVTHGGLTPLKVKYALRPTSETAIAPMLKLWIRSHKDLPLKLYQVVNIFRYETKATRPLLRMREVATFKEAHTTHATREEVEAQVMEAVNIYKEFFDELGVPHLVSKRPKWDTFAGAEYSIAFDMVCPDGRSLQIGTVHNLGQTFSKAFDITYENMEGKQEYVWQACYGISGRGVAGVLISHGDDQGFVIPPSIAPIQVVIIPIIYKEIEEQINKTCEDVAKRLKVANIKVELDLRADLTPGAKFYYWERRGVPIRVEIGPRDVKQNEVTIVRRDTLEKQNCTIGEVTTVIRTLTEEIMEDLRGKAWRWMRDNVRRVDSLEETKQLLAEKTGVVEVLWCKSRDCGLKLEKETNARILGIPLDLEERMIDGKCISCGRKATHIVRVAIAY